MRKNISEYKAVVFDLDGTLYYQGRLRIKMAWMLFSYYLCHFWRLKELFVVKDFRHVREHWSEYDKTDGPGDLDDKQYALVADRMKTDKDKVRVIIREWMYERPLKTVYETRDTDLLELIGRIKAAGQKVYIFSDYPITDKLNALGLSADGSYAATDERVNELKPSPRGLKLIMEDGNYTSDEILMVGDRMSRDGEAAINAGCDYLILPRSRSDRHKLYDTLRQER